MAIKPKIRTLTNNSVAVLNAIRNSATVDYKNYVPVATADPESIRTIGAIIMDSPSLQNEFLHALYNRIGRVVIENMTWENPWSLFKKGMLEFGETIESIFVDLAKPFQYDPAVAENEIFKREIPNVRSTFYVMNYQKFYKNTIENNDLKLAFLSWDGVTDLISKIVESMYTSANYDEFQVMKYMLAKQILVGRLAIEDIDTSDIHTAVANIKAVSNKLTFLSRKYNVAGVANATKKENQMVIMNAEFDAIVDVGVLASAFNMDKAEFMGRRVLVESFGDIDNDRLAELFADDPTYVPISDAELGALDDIPCVVVDENYFQIYDNLMEFTEDYNGQGLYWNYWYHVWKTFGVSPFANAVMFLGATPTITSVTVAPGTAVCEPGQNVSFSATVVTTNFAPQTVTWSVDSTAEGLGVTVDAGGTVYVPADVDDIAITVTASSTYDDNASDSATLTVGTPTP